MTCDVTNYVFSSPVANTKQNIFNYIFLELFLSVDYESVLAARPSIFVKEILCKIGHVTVII